MLYEKTLALHSLFSSLTYSALVKIILSGFYFHTAENILTHAVLE